MPEMLLDSVFTAQQAAAEVELRIIIPHPVFTRFA